MSKVALIIEREVPWLKRQFPEDKPLTMALPFFKSASGVYWHRVRSGMIHCRQGKWSHTHIKYWCGNGGFLGEQHKRGSSGIGQLSANPGDHAIHCAVCEGKAAGMGLDGTIKILGRTVRYSPRL